MPGLFSSSTDRGNLRTRSAPLVLLTAGPLVMVFLTGLAGLRFNATPSVPVGLYWVSSDPRAKFVEFCPPESAGPLSVARGYRHRAAGACPDRGVPLLKPVVARGGDIVELSVRGISVNGIPIPNTTPRPYDSAARPLIAWPFGRYEVAPGAMWVASSYNPRSFDSRYFGPINETAIKHRLRPIWTE
jgi:conjugative transfer signal peptidase TraF